MNKINDDTLIREMIADAWLAEDKERALYLHEHWMFELTPQLEADLRAFFGKDYDEVMKEDFGVGAGLQEHPI